MNWLGNSTNEVSYIQWEWEKKSDPLLQFHYYPPPAKSLTMPVRESLRAVTSLETSHLMSFCLFRIKHLSSIFHLSVKQAWLSKLHQWVESVISLLLKLIILNCVLHCTVQTDCPILKHFDTFMGFTLSASSIQCSGWLTDCPILKHFDTFMGFTLSASSIQCSGWLGGFKLNLETCLFW